MKVVFILDLDKISKEEWKNIWENAGIYISKINDEKEAKIINFIDNELEEDL